MKHLIAGCALLLLASGAAQAQEEPTLQAAIASSSRTPAFVARDEFRHPYETLSLFGIRPDMTVVEVWPGAGWYTEILAPYLREHGQLYAAHFNHATSSDYFLKSRKAYLAKLAAQPALYDKVAVSVFDPPDALALAPSGSADMVLTFRNVHNWAMGDDNDGIRLHRALRAMYSALKPGGVLGIVDHRLPAARPETEQRKSGYLHQDFVIDAAQRVGFELVGQSEINANPRDTADHPNGVWSLPPSLRGSDDDAARAVYRAIGESDRMTLKFIKPLQ